MNGRSMLFAGILCVSTFAHASPATMDFSCSDQSGNQLAWDAIQGSDDSSVQGIHGDVTLTVDGIKLTLSSDNAMVSPRQPLLLLRAEEGQYVIVKPVGPIQDKGDEILSSADVEIAVKGPKGTIKKHMRMKCDAGNDA